MTDIIVYYATFLQDPGIHVAPGTLAETLRAYVPGSGVMQWDAGGEEQDASYSWLRISPTGFRYTDRWKVETRFDIVSTVAGSAAQCYVGLHSTPPKDPIGDPDAKNFVGVRFNPSATVPNSYKVRAVILDSQGVQSIESVPGDDASSSLILTMTYDGAGTLMFELRNTVGSLIESGNVTTPGDLDRLTTFAIRDAYSADALAGFFAKAYWVRVTYLDVPVTDWILFSDDETGFLILDHVGNWWRDHVARETQVDALGRNWSSVYHDGAGPLYISVDGVMVVDDCEMLDEIDEWMLTAHATGRIMSLRSPIVYYSMNDALIHLWSMPHEAGRPQNLDFSLTVKSRREPDYS